MTISGIAILIGLISLVLHGGPNYSIDFQGGLSMIIRAEGAIEGTHLTEDLTRSSLAKIGLNNAEVKMTRSTEGEDLMVRVKEEARFKPPESMIRTALEIALTGQSWNVISAEKISSENMPDMTGISFVAVQTDAPERLLQVALDSAAVDNRKLIKHSAADGSTIWLLTGEGQDAASRIRKGLTQDYPEFSFDIRSIDRVGPRIGAELRFQALLAVLAALGLIILYLWWRFEFLFGLAAVIALFHDVLITLGIFSILNVEISITVVGAFLTLVGYSLNDTIVVFDRIRENLRRYKEANYAKIINRSINDNLSRTIVTSLTTMTVVLVLFFMGGEVLHSFALALLIGIIVGTYSSIYIASPILIEWAARTGKAAGKKNKR